MTLLKLVTYNIENGKQAEQLVKNIVDLSEKGINVFCLQELRKPNEEEFLGDKILHTLGPDWSAEYFLSPGKSMDFGLAIYWRKSLLHPVSFETITLPKLSKLNPHEQLFEIAKGNHIRPTQRGALIGAFKTTDKKILRICNVHFDWHGWSRQRTAQLEQVLKFIKQQPSDAEILCGDFNTLGVFGLGHKLTDMEKFLKPEFRSCFPEFVQTTAHFQHLDHIYVKNLEIKNAQVVELSGSDHYPVLAELEMA